MRTLWPLSLAVAVSVAFAACKSDSEQEHLDVTVHWSDTKQTIDGFGASSAFFGGSIGDDIADKLFDAKKGIGLSLLRIMIGVPDDTKSDGSEPTDNPKTDPTSPELNTAQQALARGAKVWATAWTPPSAWKTTNNKNGSGDGFKSNKLDSAHFRDYANYLANFVDLMAKNGVTVSGVSPANEPDYVAGWDGAQWSPEELTRFVGKDLGPVFAERCKDVQIITPDTASWPNVDSYVKPLLEDSDAKKYLSVVATHPYQNGDAPIVLDYHRPADNGKKFWETEWSQENAKGDTPDPSMVSAIDMMRKMHDHLTIANMNAWNWWSIYISPDALGGADKDKVRQNPALIQPDKNMTSSYMFKRGYSLGHWSKFVRPGFVRIAATDHPTAGVLIEAYRDESSHIALTAINTTSGTVSQNFAVEGGTFGKLTPWITSPDVDLDTRDAFDGGSKFTYDLPGQSVVTFINWDARTETPNQGTLPIVKADAGTDAKPVSSNGGLDCANALVPNNLQNGGVTDFSDWSSSRWGNPSGLNGYRYSYAGKDSTMVADVDASAKSFNAKGSVAPKSWGGAGLSFTSCVTVASFSQIQFTVSGSWPGCDMELQIKTFDQQPIDQNPAGGCYQDASAGCYAFPVVKQVAVPTSETQTVTTQLANFSSWSDQNANQVVGLQWQWTTNSSFDPDAGAGCPVEASISNITFLP